MSFRCSSPGAVRLGRNAFDAFLLFFLSLLLFQPAGAQTEQIKRVLIVNEAGVAYPAIDRINQGILKELEQPPHKVEIYSEYLETVLFPDSTSQQEFRASILHRYENRRPDVIITVGPSALRFLEETHKTAFAGIPLIFCLPTGSVPGSPALDASFTGVENDLSAGTTLETALELRPDTEHLFVVGGQSNFDKQLQIAVKQQLKPFGKRLDVVYLTSLAMPDLLEHLRHLPDRSIVLLTTVAQDAAGSRFKANESGSLVSGAANAPVFSLFDTYINHGEVGGDLSSFSLQGEIVGSMALSILGGEKPQQIPRVNHVTHYMFDWQALRRWGLKESNLPPGSTVLNRQRSFWQLNERYLVAGGLALLAQTFVILGLLWQRTKRRKTEKDLMVTNELFRDAIKGLRESEERFRLLCNNAPVMIWMSDVNNLCIFANQRWLEFTGRCAAEELGNGWTEGIHPEDRDNCFRIYSAAFDRREPYEIKYRARRHDGEYCWIVDLGIPRFGPDGSFAGYIGSCNDISEHLLAEQALSSVSRRLIEAHEEERTWIARELHDDVNQRLALASVNLDVLKRELPDSARDARGRVAELGEQIKELGSDVQALSHRLHSSKLEYLGLTAAVTTFCREFSERNGVQIDLECDAIPRTMPGEISLCLFRVLQEALQNASKHSGSQQYHVSIKSGVNEIDLTVSDSGIGFDLQQAAQGRGLGITSMRERLKLVGGELSIEPRSPKGVVVRATVPIPELAKSAGMGKT